MKFLLSYLWEKRRHIAAFIICVAIMLSTFALYKVPMETVLYPLFLCILAMVLFAAGNYTRERKKHTALMLMTKLPENMEETLGAFEGRSDRDYREIIELLTQRERRSLELSDSKMADMMDYYTTWVHQIKTPIASMRLTLGSEDSTLSRRVTEDLSRVEQYVEMVLAYLRLDSDSTDYVFRAYELDGIIRQSVRKFAGQFINSGLKLEYAPTGAQAVTDEKWLCFMIEQILSNSLKYTSAGSVRIYMEPHTTLCIADTGIGIAPEDLPRIFERGYTGQHGRDDKRASGLGLYLCKRTCDKLGYRIWAESLPDVGTTVRICLEKDSVDL